MSINSIGVFDSGIGGLSVVKQIMSILPNENIIYFGDIARIPYGTKSVEKINHYTSQTVKFLLEKQVKAIVIACNTITAVAYNTVRQIAGDIPVIDVISSGSIAVTENNLYHKIGVIATPATIRSHAYTNAIHQINSHIEIESISCPLLVPLIEDGLLHKKALELIVSSYLEPFNPNNIEALILGCTHYPLIADVIQNIIGNDVKVVDPAVKTSQILLDTLKSKNMLVSTNAKLVHHFYVTDNVNQFKQMGEMFLNTRLDNVELIAIEQSSQ